MSEVKITRKEFEDRLIALVLSGGAPGLPRRLLDRRVLLTTICLELDRRRAFTQKEIDQRLAWWPHRMGGRFGLDPATLRRALVDDGYLLRDRAGYEYRVCANILQGVCDPSILEINPVECLQVELERRMVARMRAAEWRERHGISSEEPAPE